MGANIIRKDSIKDRKKKTNEQLAKENAELRAQVASLEVQAKEQADALIELAAIIVGEG